MPGIPAVLLVQRFMEEMNIRGTLVNTHNKLWDPIFVVDEAYLKYLPMFEIELDEPVALNITNPVTAMLPEFILIIYDLAVDFNGEVAAALCGSRATFRVDALFISDNPNYRDGIYGSFTGFFRNT